jgi:hypothetical protein
MPNHGSILQTENTYQQRQEFRGNRNKLPDMKDLPIRYPGHPKFNKNEVEVTDPIETIVQKLELLLLTNKGEVIGAPNYGGDLEYLLWQTDLSADVIESELGQQVSEFIPELDQMGYNFSIQLFEGDFRDILYLNFLIQGQNYLYLWA